MNTCELCGGELGLLGTLGRLVWLVCRDCGMQFSRKAEDFNDNEESDHWDCDDGYVVA